ncbi:hypothetical protein LJC73_06990, partial [Bacteroidales bacterium OttesenSCG-928-L14]|nr:hypothetical protein [Bacteroidales bacterium OttesenSCG-928-L14]
MSEDLFKELIDIYSLENDVYLKTKESFNILHKAAESFEKSFKHYHSENKIHISLAKHGTNEFELTVGSDMIIFVLHTNVFEFSRNHEIMKTPYMRENKDRAQCGQILIYNFIADSISLRRGLDVGYMIGRIMINNEGHYFVEGKKEIGMLLNKFATDAFDENAADNILKSAIEYVMHFAPLVPDYSLIQELTVEQFIQIRDFMQIRTSKRMGFTFNRDNGGE